MPEITVSWNELQELCVNKLIKEQLSSEHAETVAEVLVHANLRGVDSHGVMRMEHYLRRLRAGGINPNPKIQVEHKGPTTAIVDGDDGFGHIIAKAGMDTAIELAEKYGIGMVSMKNSSHCGALSYFVKQAASKNLIGMMMTNTDAFIVPFGAAEPYFGTNPLAYGFPARQHPPIVIDMATSQVAVGKVLHAKEAGKSIPLDWGVDETGKPTSDPNKIVALFPFGGQKGSGLAMVVDVFSGVLTGSAFGSHVSVMYGDYHKQRKLGHFAFAINASSFTDQAEFLDNIDQLIDDVHALEPAEGFTSVMVPGEPEYLKEQARLKEGIPIPESIYQFLKTDT
jgi:ureidoglycolate dehydrogenase (NAD+)